jgi:hypothetical protein
VHSGEGPLPNYTTAESCRVKNTFVVKEMPYLIPEEPIHGAGPVTTMSVKGKVIPLHAMESHGGRGGIAPTHS